MQLNKINGNTYYINSPTNIGVFAYKNKNCLLVDTGINSSAARKIDAVLSGSSLHPKYILNTHSHPDHCGGNSYFRETYTGSVIYASAKEKLYIENLDLRANMLFSSLPVKELKDDCKETYVDFVPDYGEIKINDEKFEIIQLKGHSPEGIGLITKDRVCFLGDSIFSETVLEKYSFPYLFNIEESLKTLDRIMEIDSDYFVVSHSEEAYSPDKIRRLATRNKDNINDYLFQILELLDKPHSKEELLESLIVLNSLQVSYRQYHINFSSMSSFISYLCNKGEVSYSAENGKVYYYKA